MAAPRAAAAEPLLDHPRFRKACCSVASCSGSGVQLGLAGLTSLVDGPDICLHLLLRSLCLYTAMSSAASNLKTV